MSWVGGEVGPRRSQNLDVPVILDGAQGVGAVHVDLRGLGCAAYAASGQKWLCGADGTGMLWMDPAFAERVELVTAGYMRSPTSPPGWRRLPRHDRALRHASLPREAVALSLAATSCWRATAGTRSRSVPPGWPAARRRAARAGTRGDAARRHDARELGGPVRREVRPRLAEAGIVIRELPGRSLLRASVGAWNDESDLQRLLDAIAA